MPSVGKKTTVKAKTPAPAKAKPLPPVGLNQFLGVRCVYVGWIQALQSQREWMTACLGRLAKPEFETLLGSAYDLLAAHDHEGRRWYKEYQPTPTEKEMKGNAKA